MLFYTGVTRSADTILAEQRANIACTRPQLDLLRDLAGVAVDRSCNGDIDAVGAALRESWEAKRKLAPGVSNAQIDDAVARALDAGASGAKVTGAGGGGFLARHVSDRATGRRATSALADMRELPREARPARFARRAQRRARHLELRSPAVAFPGAGLDDTPLEPPAR